MKSLFRIAFPIALLAGASFGITLLVNYLDSGRDDTKTADVPAVAPPLRFFTLTADPASEAKFMRYWDSNVEVGSSGRFDYWALNANDKPVNVSVPNKNCQCTSVQIGIVDPAAYGRYQWNLALGGFLGTPGLLWNALGVKELGAGIEWKPLNVDGAVSNAVVPPARAGIPQAALVRLSWVGKPGESVQRRISATVMANLPGATEKATELDAHIAVVSSFALYIPTSRDGALAFGDMTPDSRKSMNVTVWSTTRPALDITLAVASPYEGDPHITWTPPVDLNDAELAALYRELSDSENRKTAADEGKPKKRVILPPVRSAQKTTVTLAETVGIERDGKKQTGRLDLGPLERRLLINQGKEQNTLALRASVRGEIRILGGSQEVDRVDFGQPFSAKQAKYREVIIQAERPDTDLELVGDVTTPDILKTTLTPLPPRDGRPQWSLKVTIPAGKLVGSLPASAAVILRTKGAGQRKIRIPVAAQSHGGSEF